MAKRRSKNRKITKKDKKEISKMRDEGTTVCGSLYRLELLRKQKEDDLNEVFSPHGHNGFMF